MMETPVDDAATVVERQTQDKNGGNGNGSDSNSNTDVEKTPPRQTSEWDKEPTNPYNWPTWRKATMVFAITWLALTTSIATSIVSPSRTQLMQEFNISSTVAILPLTLYVLALGFGPIVGGPLSETIGRYPVYMGGLFFGSVFTIGVGFTHNFGALCFLRFLAGFFWAPLISIVPGSVSETFSPQTRGPVSAICVLMPFLGPGLGPVIGSFVVTNKDWRWIQWTLLFFAAFCFLLSPFLAETFHPILKRRLAKKRGEELPPLPPLADQLKSFVQVALVRPILMIFTDPIVGFICLYVAVDFGTLFSFFAGVPYTFGTVHHFDTNHSGLIFLSIVIGCLIGLVTMVLCDIFIYRKQVPKYPPQRVPPEYRLYPAMIGSFGLPIGLFWFAWSAKPEISWASPAAAIVPFAWGNLCVFISLIQFCTDTYTADVVASASSANSLARYGFAGVFPLFTLQMYQALGIAWASSLLGFVSLALLPIPFILFKYGPKIRARSTFDTVKYEE